MEAIRQDKIGYILTVFRTEGMHPETPHENPLDCLIGGVVSSLTHTNLQNITVKRLNDRFDSYKDLANADITHIVDCLALVRFPFKKAAAIKSLLSWAYSNFGKYSLNPIRTWDDIRILNTMNNIEGINRPTIAIMMCLSLGRDILPVDAHVRRVSTRIGISSNSWTKAYLFRLINSYIPFGQCYFLYRNLIEFGKESCRRDDPQCSRCFFSDVCDLNLSKNDWAYN